VAKLSKKKKVLFVFLGMVALFLIANVLFVIQSHKNISEDQLRALDPRPADVKVSTQELICVRKSGIQVDQLTRTYKTTLPVDQVANSYKASDAQGWTPVNVIQTEPDTNHLGYQKLVKGKYVGLDVFIPEKPQIFADGTYEYKAILQVPTLKAVCNGT
jgi:hypothetical protein